MKLTCKPSPSSVKRNEKQKEQKNEKGSSILEKLMLLDFPLHQDVDHHVLQNIMRLSVLLKKQIPIIVSQNQPRYILDLITSSAYYLVKSELKSFQEQSSCVLSCHQQESGDHTPHHSQALAHIHARSLPQNRMNDDVVLQQNLDQTDDLEPERLLKRLDPTNAYVPFRDAV